jgi:hypothetical protein
LLGLFDPGQLVHPRRHESCQLGIHLALQLGASGCLVVGDTGGYLGKNGIFMRLTEYIVALFGSEFGATRPFRPELLDSAFLSA